MAYGKSSNLSSQQEDSHAANTYLLLIIPPFNNSRQRRANFILIASHSSQLRQRLLRPEEYGLNVDLVFFSFTYLLKMFTYIHTHVSTEGFTDKRCGWFDEALSKDMWNEWMFICSLLYLYDHVCSWHIYFSFSR